MSTNPDDLDKLLSDVKKTMDENRLFLETLADDTRNDFCESGEEENKESEAFEEL
jgi:hypothetical protein